MSFESLGVVDEVPLFKSQSNLHPSFESLQSDTTLVIFHDLVVQDVLDSVIHAIHDYRDHLLGWLWQRQSHIRKDVVSR